MKVLARRLIFLALALLASLVHGQSISLTYRNADSSGDGAPFADGAVVDLAMTPKMNVVAEARAFLARLGVSVVFQLDGKVYSTDNTSPYIMTEWTPTLGAHVLVATLHRRNRGKGRKLKSVTVKFTVVNSAIPAPKAPVPTTPTVPTGGPPVVTPIATPPVAAPMASPPVAAPMAGTPVAVVVNVVITEIMRNPDKVFDNFGEWFEVYNAGNVAVNLFNWTIKDDDTDTQRITSNLTIPPGAYAVLANNGAASTNGGIPFVNYTYNGTALFLAQNDDELVLVDSSGVERDRVVFTAAGGFPTPTGASIALRNPGLDNAVGANWCVASTAYGLGDFGTPGRANDCPVPAPTVPAAPTIPAAPSAPIGQPPVAVTRIHAVQGVGAASPNLDTTVSVIGIATSIFTRADVLAGFFLQEEVSDQDTNSQSSEGIFVNCTLRCPTPVSSGDLVQVVGVVNELFGLTQINTTGTSSSYTVLSTGNPLPTPVSVFLPANASIRTASTFENLEGMLVTFPGTLVVSEYFQLARFGQLVLTESSRPYQFTNGNVPNASAYSAFLATLNTRRIVLDDDNDDENDATTGAVDEPFFYPTPGLSLTNKFRGGDTIVGLTGVLQYAFGTWRVRPVRPAYSYTFTSVNPRPSSPPNVGGRLRVLSFNVLNYFTTRDDGPDICSPNRAQDCRGADSDEELFRQRNKTVSALVKLNPDIIGVIELENSNDNVPLDNLVAALNRVVGSSAYTFVPTGPIGTDAIRCGFIYKNATVSLTSPFKVLNTTIDPRFNDTKNRPVIVQTFTETSSRRNLTVAVNHFKSKGSDCNDVGDRDLSDGQANCPITRLNAAIALVSYLQTDPTGSNSSNFLIIGDLNSYAKEPPITALTNGGYVNLLNASASYGYVFDGQLGSLDYALASAALKPQVTGAEEWNINADEIPIFDYNDGVRDAGESLFERESTALPIYANDEYRSSDHDPVLVGITLTA